MNFLHTDARWTEHFVEVNDPHKEGHHVRFYFERPWVGLTDEEIYALESATDTLEFPQTVRAIEAKLKTLNNLKETHEHN
jgi:hypothetical protein